MILQALVRCYEALAERGELEKEGWSPVKVSWGLELDADGQVKSLLLMGGTDAKGKQRPRIMKLPDPVKRSSGVAANFLCDNSAYVLGVDAKGKPERTRECFAACAQKHLNILKDVQHPTAKAILNFFERWKPENAACHPAIQPNLEALLKGGKAVMLCLIVSIVMIPLQNFLGGGVMEVFGCDPLLGIGCGSIALIGGPGTAAAFGPDLEAAGAVGGSVVSIAAATFGLVAGSLMGGPTARRLIEKHNLRPETMTAIGGTQGVGLATDVASEDERFITNSPRFVKGFMLLLLAVGIGNQVSVWLTALTDLTFPAYIGAMLVAVVVRNAMDGVHVEYPTEEIDTMGNMFLSIFLAMALAGLKLWELIDLALPMIVCLVLQCIVMFLFSYFVVFNVMGRGYDAAVMTAGFIGFAMGATSNAMANMQVVTKKYGPSPVAYFAIPMVGGMFIDFFNAVLISANISWWA